MRIFRAYSSVFLGLALLICFGLAQNGLRNISAGETDFVPAPPHFMGLSIDPRIVRRLLGCRLFVADLLWIDTLVKADITHEHKSFTDFYKAFKTITDLDPDNLYAYYVAGVYLSVVKDDIKGATAILRDGVARMAQTPGLAESRKDAWNVPFLLGYNLMFEEHEFDEGAKWIRKAGTMPNAPRYVSDLASSVKSERGTLEIASHVLIEARRYATTTEDRNRIDKKLLDLAVQEQLIDLNERFQRFLSSTDAYALPRKKAYLLFMKTIGHPRKDLMGRPIGIDQLGRISVLGK